MSPQLRLAFGSFCFEWKRFHALVFFLPRGLTAQSGVGVMPTWQASDGTHKPLLPGWRMQILQKMQGLKWFPKETNYQRCPPPHIHCCADLCCENWFLHVIIVLFMPGSVLHFVDSPPRVLLEPSSTHLLFLGFFKTCIPLMLNQTRISTQASIRRHTWRIRHPSWFFWS